MREQGRKQFPYLPAQLPVNKSRRSTVILPVMQVHPTICLPTHSAIESTILPTSHNWWHYGRTTKYTTILCRKAAGERNSFVYSFLSFHALQPKTTCSTTGGTGEFTRCKYIFKSSTCVSAPVSLFSALSPHTHTSLRCSQWTSRAGECPSEAALGFNGYLFPQHGAQFLLHLFY